MFRAHIDYDMELEEKVLGVFLMEPSQYSETIGILREECFYTTAAREVYKAMRTIFEKGYAIDYVTVQRSFFDRGVTEIEGSKITYIITRLFDGVVSSANILTWCLMLREMAANRLMFMLKNSGSLKGDAFEEAADLEKQLRAIMDVKVVDDWVHISEVMVKLGKHMDEVKRLGVPGVGTSVKELDSINHGFRDTNLIVIGARPRVGKSAFMGRIATHAAFNKKKVGIISLEMQDMYIVARSAAAESDVDFWRIDINSFNEERKEQERVYQAMAKLSTLPIYYSDTAQVNIHEIRAKAEKLRSKYGGIDLLIIDYLQLIESDSASNFKNREQEVSKISRGLKILAMNMKIPIIVLAQLNRQSEEAKSGKKPQLHHLRESGSIEQDADVVMFLHRDYASGIERDENGRDTSDRADLLVRKWRNGAECDIKLGFDGPKMKFYELEEELEFKGGVSQQPEKANAGFKNRRNVLPPENEDLPF